MPRLLDLFCGAGGCSMGYSRAGFDVTGVDLHPQPRYPFRFFQGDALEYLAAHGHEFDVIHASPPCQRFTKGAGKAGTRDRHPDLLAPCRDLLVRAGKPWVIENVEQAATTGRAMRADLMLCGTMFGLGVFRHRAFESSAPLEQPPHPKHDGKVGDGKYQTVAGNAGGRSRRDGTAFGGVDAWKTAMGIEWMTGKELAQAIPPTYAEFVGKQLIAPWRTDAQADACGDAGTPEPGAVRDPLGRGSPADLPLPGVRHRDGHR